MNYHAVGTKLLVKRILPEKKVSALIMPDEPLPRWIEADVVSWGDNVTALTHGLRVIISPYAGMEFFDGLWLIDEKDIMATVRDVG
jgi:co-chaperonin GroES (HSP10)